jgi:hypothetical protein
MGKLGSNGAYVAKRGKSVANFSPAERRVMAHAVCPLAWPVQVLDQFTGQAKRQIEGANPRLRLTQPLYKLIQRQQTFQLGQLNPPAALLSQRENDWFFSAGTAGKITPDQEWHISRWRVGAMAEMAGGRRTSL